MTDISNDSLWRQNIGVISSVAECNKAQNAIESYRTTIPFSLVYLIVLIMLTLAIIIKYFYSDYYMVVIPSALSMKVYAQNLHLKKVIPFIPNLLMYVIRVLGITMIVEVLLRVFFPEFHLPLGYKFMGVLGFLGILNIAEYILNKLVYEGDTYVMHFYQKQIIQVIVMIIAIPMVLYILKEPTNITIYFVYTLIITLISQYLILAWRWMILLKLQKPYQLLYYFIYFCTLKLIPILIIARWVSNFDN